MCQLYYVPILHKIADFGSLAPTISEKGITLLGEDAWQEHQQVIANFWTSLSNFFKEINVSGWKIYQDGMVAEGELAKKIVDEAVRKGSKNYEIIQRMLAKGAKIVRTEDIDLLKAELRNITALAQAKTFANKALAYARYRWEKERLLKKRDSYIAKRINETLKEGETGVLFIGAEHKILPHLAKDIKIIQVKNRKKIQAYQRSLLIPKNKDKLALLAQYLSSPIDGEGYG